MTVNSPFSKNTLNGCVKNGTGPLPTNGVIYVQNVPSSATDVNFTSGCPYNVNSRTHPLGMPTANDTTTYACRNGDVFIEGTLKGQLTVASENNIVVTWALQYQSGVSGTDLLGLIANNNVELWHPVQCAAGTTTSSCNLNVELPGRDRPRHTVQQPDRPGRDPLDQPLVPEPELVGRLTPRHDQPDRCDRAAVSRPVGTSSSGTILTGYAKGYVYDQRLKYLSPPKFLDPVASAWGIAVWKEIKVPAGL